MVRRDEQLNFSDERSDRLLYDSRRRTKLTSADDGR